MNKKKHDFWDYKKPNFLSYLLLPFTLPVLINNFLINLKKNNRNNKNIKNICVGNIYVGGTGKTPLSIKLSQILNTLNFKTVVIKKFYKDQIDEQKLLADKTKLYCAITRKDALNKAIKDNSEIAIFDDGLQDRSIDYNLRFVCFNSLKWIGNGFLIPAGPLREKIESISKYDAVFLNTNQEDVSEIKILLKKYNSNIKIFETYYFPANTKELNKYDNYLIFSGIGNPESFKNILIKNGFKVVKEIKFPDHYNYKKDDINKIKLIAKNMNAKILTTAKDYIKLNPINSSQINFLEIELNIKEENKLINFIKTNL